MSLILPKKNDKATLFFSNPKSLTPPPARSPGGHPAHSWGARTRHSWGAPKHCAAAVCSACAATACSLSSALLGGTRARIQNICLHLAQTRLPKEVYDHVGLGRAKSSLDLPPSYKTIEAKFVAMPDKKREPDREGQYWIESPGSDPIKRLCFADSGELLENASAGTPPSKVPSTLRCPRHNSQSV